MLQGYAQHLVTFSVKKQEKNDMSDVEGREKGREDFTECM